MLTRAALERHQVWWYLTAVLVGLALGSIFPGAGEAAEAGVWPLIALLLFATFTQVPLKQIPAAFADRRFLVAAVGGNFVILPAAVWGLVHLAPADEALRLGLLLVLLVPCTDWFITFSQLGRGDATRATAITPANLLLQLALLPLYLWLMTGESAAVIGLSQVWPAVVVVLAPLAAALLAERWLARSAAGERTRDRLGHWPVPLLSLVILCVAFAHVGEVGEASHLLLPVAGIAVVFLVLALALAWVLTRALNLSIPAGRTLAFSFATRNSFVVLPFALALPAGWELAALVIVIQSLVELFGMAICIWFVPRVLLRDRH